MAQHTGFAAYSFNSCAVRPTVLTKLKQRVDHAPTKLKPPLKVSTAAAAAGFNDIMADIAAAFAKRGNGDGSENDEEKRRSDRSPEKLLK